MHSITTRRKIQKIEEILGSDWKQKSPDTSIDTLYTQLMGDDRENLFCKVGPGTKQMLKELSSESDQSMANVIQNLITKAHREMKKRQQDDARELAKQFSQVGD